MYISKCNVDGSRNGSGGGGEDDGTRSSGEIKEVRRAEEDVRRGGSGKSTLGGSMNMTSDDDLGVKVDAVFVLVFSSSEDPGDNDFVFLFSALPYVRGTAAVRVDFRMSILLLSLETVRSGSLFSLFFLGSLYCC